MLDVVIIIFAILVKDVTIHLISQVPYLAIATNETLTFH